MKPIVFAIHAALGGSLLLGCATTHAPAVIGQAAPTVQAGYSVRGAAEADDYYRLGRHYHAQGRSGQALDAYRKALALDPKHLDARNATGMLYASSGDYERAVQEFNIALGIDPRSAQTYNNLGYTLYLRQRFAAAVDVLRRALALDPTSARIWNNLGSALASAGERDQALAAFARAEDLSTARSDGSSASFIAAAPAPLSAAPAAPESVPDAASDAPTLSLVPIAPATNAAPTVVPFVASEAVGFARVVEPISSPIAAALLDPREAVAIDTIELPLAAAQVDGEPAAAAPPTGGVVVTEVPTGAEVLATGPATVELRWTGTAVIARPADPAGNAPHATYRLEVANGNGVTGMARKVARLFADIGMPRARLTNQRPFAQRESQIQYVEGHHRNAVALSERLPGQPPVVPVASLRSGADVRILLGRDLPRNVALVPPVPLHAKGEAADTPRVSRSD